MTHTAKHTPGLPVCTCHIQTETVDTGIGAYEEYHIEQCSLHTAAPAMYEALQAAYKLLREWTPSGEDNQGEVEGLIENALAQAEGSKP